MKNVRNAILTTTLISLFSVGSASAAVVVSDDFNDGALDTAWGAPILDNVAGWSGNESGTDFTVSDITPPSYTNSTINIPRSKVTLSQTFAAVTDFNAHVKMSWDSANQYDAMQDLRVILYDVDNNVIAGGGYNDSWVQFAGQIFGFGGGSSYGSGASSAALADSLIMDIVRVGSAIDIQLNGSSVLNTSGSGLLNRIDVTFSHAAYSGSLGTSSYGSQSIDLVSVEGQLANVPLPSMFSLMGLGLLGMAARKRKAVHD